MTEEIEDLESEVPEQENALAMSDEDIMNMSEPPGGEAAEGGSIEEEEEEENELLLDSNVTEQPPEEESNENITPEETVTGENDGLQKEEQEASKEEVDTFNYKAELAKLFTPFKANGRQMQIRNIDDAISLMQMGANYNKKMAGLKPNLRLLKMLEKNELLDEGKISNLIDLSRQNPAAIQDLIQKSGIDPLDLDVEEESNYQPETYTVDDKEVDLDSVLEDIQDTTTFNETIDIISNKWDGPSKQVLLDNPSLIKVINEHVESGIYNSIHEIVENERALGRLTDMSDIQAYKHVGDVIQANGGFAPQQIPQPQATVQPPPSPKAVGNPKLKSRKRAAAATKTSPGSTPAEYNPLAMSDEEFEKVAAQYM